MTNKSLMTDGNCPVNSHNEWDPCPLTDKAQANSPPARSNARVLQF